MTDEEFLREAAQRIGVGEVDADLFLSYSELLRRWGGRVNLTSVLDGREIIIRHLVDSLTAVEFLPPGSRVLDIGTGAGFPGIPLYIHDRSLRMTLVESVGKKVAFLKQAKRSLGLPGVHICHRRAGNPPRGIRGSFDRVTFRAVGNIDSLAALAVPYLDIGGRIVIMKGPRGKAEWLDYSKRSPGEMELVSAKELALPFSGEKRVIIVTRPVRGPEESGA